MFVAQARCPLCGHQLMWDVAEEAWVTPEGYSVCPTDRFEHDPHDLVTGESLLLYVAPTF